jgi:hypothetical protein
MDRSDERKENRAGDVLGLGGDIRSDADDITRTPMTDEEAQRRRRMNEGADDIVGGNTDTTGVPRGSGATGIDMGAGGEGTGIE